MGISWHLEEGIVYAIYPIVNIGGKNVTTDGSKRTRLLLDYNSDGIHKRREDVLRFGI